MNLLKHPEKLHNDIRTLQDFYAVYQTVATDADTMSPLSVNQHKIKNNIFIYGNQSHLLGDEPHMPVCKCMICY